jgi:hypothetical protein
VRDAKAAVLKAERQRTRCKVDVDEAADESNEAAHADALAKLRDAETAHAMARSRLVSVYRSASRIVPQHYPELWPELQQAAGSTDATLRTAPYRIVDFTLPRLQSGHPGGVVRARQRKRDADDDGTAVALKRFDDFAKFEREVKAQLRGEGSHVAPVLYTFEDQQRWYLATPWYDGGAVDGWLRHLAKTHNANGSSPSSVLAVALRMASQVTSAFARLHAQGIAHGDVKPANVVVGGLPDEDAIDAVSAAERCEPYLIDFGIAIPVDGKLDLLYQTLSATMVGGTLAYAAPEVQQALAQRNVDGIDFRAADAYSLARLITDMIIAAVGTAVGWERATPLPADGGAARRHVVGLLRQLSGPTPSQRPTLAEAHLLLQKAVIAEDTLRCSVCESQFRRTTCVWCSVKQHIYCTECVSTMVTSVWRTGIRLSTHEQRGAVVVTCEGFPGCGAQLVGEGMRRLRPDAALAVDATKGDFEALRAVKAETGRLATQGLLGPIEAAVSALFIPKCPWCGLPGSFDFRRCMSIICGNRECKREYCGYCLLKGDAHAHVGKAHAKVFDGVKTPHASQCSGEREPAWTCEPRWRVAWYHTRRLETRAVALYSLVDNIGDRQASWQRLLGDVAPFPAELLQLKG